MKLWMALLVLGILFTKNAFGRSILENVETKFENQTFIAELEFDKVPSVDDALVEYINQTIQLSLPNATVKHGKSFIKVKGNEVKSVYSYQFSKDLLRTRIILTDSIDASKYEGYVKISRSGNKLLISVQNPETIASSIQQPEVEIVPPIDLNAELDKKLKPSKNPKDIVAKELELPVALPEKTLKDAVEKQEIKIESSASEIKKTKQDNSQKLAESQIPVFKKKSEAKIKESGSPMRLLYSLVIVVVFSAGLLGFAKWWNKNHKINDKNTKIQVLTQHHLGPKKSLTIVRVAGESLLLGVTDHNINLIKPLSFIDDEIVEVPNDFVQVMSKEEGRPESEVEEQKLTYSPDVDLVADLRRQVAGKLKSLKDI